MNYRAIGHYLGVVMKVNAALLLVPLALSLLYRDFRSVFGFVATIVLSLIVAILLGLQKPQTLKIYAKEGFLTVAMSWFLVALFGALPFHLSGELPSFVDCLFESISGFTTTGATVVENVEGLSKGLLFWRGFSHWIGGMGVLVFLMAVIPAFATDRALYMMKAESPGPAPGKLVPKLRQSAKLLYIIYFALTAVECVLLLFGGMPLFDAIVHSMSTAGTGGFSVHSASIAAYNSVYIETVITVFMILFGINFNLFFYMLMRNFAGVFKNTELRVYLGIIVGAIVVICVNLTGTVYHSVGTSLRHAAFQVSSIMTSTGFATVNFDLWPQFSKTVLLMLMFIGACSGSTGGGIKVSRFIIAAKECKRTLSGMIRPRSVEIVKMDGKQVDKQVVYGVSTYFVMYMAIFLVSCVLVSVDNFDLESTFSAVACCLNNTGQGFSQSGPAGSFAVYSGFTKLVLSLNMLLGRLELYPILLMISPRTWRRV